MTREGKKQSPSVGAGEAHEVAGEGEASRPEDGGGVAGVGEVQSVGGGGLGTPGRATQRDSYPAVRRAMRWSLGVSVLMLVGKVGAFWVTGSAAILSDAMESVIHIVATGLAAWSAWYASLPPDKRYPYGYGKIAYFSAGFEGGLIFIAALSILYKAIEALIVGPKLHKLDIGLSLIVGLGVVNLFLGLYLLRVGRRERSLILEANGKHVLTDMWTSAAVAVGVFLVWVTGALWLDPVVAILAGLQIMYTAGKLLYQAFRGLMEQVEPTRAERIVEVLERAVAQGEITDFHQLRFRSVQETLWLELHLLLPGRCSLEHAHRVACKVEDELTALFPTMEVHITSHLEPDAHDRAHPEGHGEFGDPLGS